MDKQEIIDYVMNTPYNVNRTILGQMLEGKDGSGGSGGEYSAADIASCGGIDGNLAIDFIINRPYAFAYFNGIKKIIFKKGGGVEKLVHYVFEDCSVEEVVCEDGVPGHGYQTTGQFRNCKKLRRVTAPLMETQNSGFENCTALESVDIRTITPSDNGYQNCNNLKTIILRSLTLVPLGAGPSYWAFVLNQTPFDPDWANATGGFVLVPSALAAEYSIATNWSALCEAGKCTFLPLEEYTVDGTTTGAINWDKLNAVVYAE